MLSPSVISHFCYIYVHPSPAQAHHPIPPYQWKPSQNPVPSVGDDPTNPESPASIIPTPNKTTKKTTDPPSSSVTGIPRCAILQDLVQFPPATMPTCQMPIRCRRLPLSQKLQLVSSTRVTDRQVCDGSRMGKPKNPSSKYSL